MKAWIFVAAVALSTTVYGSNPTPSSNEERDPTPGDLLRDQVDGTDVFAIPLDQSNVMDNYDIKEMREDQREYFEKHPEAYEKWIENRAKYPPRP